MLNNFLSDRPVLRNDTLVARNPVRARVQTVKMACITGETKREAQQVMPWEMGAHLRF